MNIDNLVEQITQKVMSQIHNNQKANNLNLENGKTTQFRTIMITVPEMVRMIDHTLLKPDCTQSEIINLCDEAKQHGFATVCVNPYWVPLVKQKLHGTEVGITTVIGFPLGCTTTYTKISEARDAIASGATEIDMVMNISALKSGDLDTVKKDIEGVVQACKGQAIVKVILETGLLTTEEKQKACIVSKMAGADFVKTSTGFIQGGATVEDIALMRKTVGNEMGVKASGGIRDIDFVRSLIMAGANRIGASSSVGLVTTGSGTGY